MTSLPRAFEGANSDIYLGVLSDYILRRNAMHLQRGDQASTANRESNDTSSKNHTPYLVRRSLYKRSKGEQYIRDENDSSPPEPIRQYSRQRARDEGKETRAGSDKAFI